ncbi:DUF11 domain-containing protein [Allofranklinella schreckenbergeri]|nr:DUF11 domain-containing protein [Allofranklinella schreckenbergeri]
MNTLTSPSRRPKATPRVHCSKVALTALLAVCAASPLHAQVTDVVYANAYDGDLAPFDTQTGPGYDNGRNNDIVRTNDAFAYSVTLRSQYPATGASDITVKAKFPADTLADWQRPSSQLCNGGITISNDHAAGPELSCKINTLAASGTRDLTFVALASGKAPNGHSIVKPTFSIDVGGGQGSTVMATNDSGLKNITVSAYPFYDVVVQPSYQGSPKPYGFYAENGPVGEDGFYHRPLVGLRAMHPNAGRGRIGVEMLNGQPIVLNIQLSEPGLQNARLVTWDTHARGARGSFLRNNAQSKGCGSPARGSMSAYLGGGVNMHSLVNDAGQPSSDPKIVPNGGTCSVTQAGPGGQITLTLTGVDTSLQRRPSRGHGSAGNAIPQDEWWVANKALVLWTPMADYPAPNPPDPVVKYPHKLSVTDIAAVSISGQAVTIGDAAEQTPNNETSYELWREGGGSYSKRYVPDGKREIPFKTLQDPAAIGDVLVNQMAVGQSVSARLIYSNTGTTTHTNAYICETIDRTAFRLGDRHEVRGTIFGDVVEYGRRPAGKYFASTSVNDKNDEYQYAITYTSDYRDASCADPNIQWTRQTTPGVVPVPLDDVVYIRIKLGALKGGHYRTVFIDDLILENTWQENISVKTGGVAGVPTQRNRGDLIAPATQAEGPLILNRGEVGSDFFSPARLVYDYLRVVPSRTVSRVAKEITSPVAPSGGGDPVVARGSTVQYALTARYSTHTPLLDNPQGKYVVTVVDYLPPHMSYVDGSESVAAINSGNISGYKFSTSAGPNGTTKLEWVFDQVVPVVGDNNAAAEFAKITFSAKVADNAPASTPALMNNVAVTSNFDTEGACKLDNADEGFYLMVHGNKRTSCEKSATAKVLLGANNGAYDIRKQALKPDGSLAANEADAAIQPGQDFGYLLTYEAKDFPTSGVNIPHWIDVLPWVGDGRGSAFERGAYNLKSVSAVGGDPAAKVYYTDRKPNSIQIDPRHPDNTDASGAVNTANWCLMPGCSFSIDETTAIHIVPGVNAMPLGQQYKLTLTFATNAAVAKSGDKYANSINGRSPTDASPLLLVSKPAEHHVYIPQPVVHSLSGRVYWDKDGSGDLDSAKDEYIQATVTLLGCEAGSDGTIESSDGGSCAPTDVSRSAVSIDVSATDGLFQFTDLPKGIYRLQQDSTGIGAYKNGVTTAGTVAGAVNGVAEGTPGTEPQKSAIKQIRLEGITAQAGVDYLFGEVKISAVNDDYTANPLLTTGGTTPATEPVTKNDLANGVSVNLDPVTGNATITGVGVVGGNPATGDLVLNADGTITVQPNTPAGTYEYEYKLCLRSPYEMVCTTAKAKVKVEAGGGGGGGGGGGTSSADLSVNKVVDKLKPQVGSEVVFTLSAHNAGPSPVSAAQVTDLLPSGYTFVSAAPATSYDAATGVWTVGALSAGSSRTLRITAKVNATGSYANTAEIAGGTGDPADPKTDNNSSTVTPVPVAAPGTPLIDAVNDSFGSVPGDKSTTTPSVLVGDTANGQPATGSNVTLTPGKLSQQPAKGSIKMNPDGTLTITAGTTPGDYEYSYKICLKAPNDTVCDEAVAKVTVGTPSTPVIDAVNDSFGTVPGDKPTTTPSVLVGDTANGQPATGSNVTLTPGKLSQQPAKGSIKMNPDGTLTIAAGTTPGDYEYSYKICLKAPNETVCDEAVAKVTVGTPSTPVIDAVNDSFGTVPGDKPTTTPSVLVGDTANGQPATGSNVTLTPGKLSQQPAKGSIKMNPDGTLTIAAGTTPGDYEYSYKICLKAPNDTVCDEAVAKVTVGAVTLIHATDDEMKPIAGKEGGKTPSVLGDNGGGLDTAVGGPADASNVKLIPGQAPQPAEGAITMDADGTITVTPGTTPGTYTYPYTICLVAASTVCDSATATVVVAGVADMGVLKTVEPGVVAAGDKVTFTITVKNHGPSDALDVQVTEALPSGYTLVSATPSVGTFAAPVWKVGTLVNGASATLKVVATVNATGDYLNVVTVSTASSDSVHANNQASVMPASLQQPTPPASAVPVPANAPWAVLLVMLAMWMLAYRARFGRK